ncbi:MAG: type II secretion system secretin GspD [Planctomycetes bacterium]|jgi:general secretion pathway protein D|nr:type II secretion system secretin GspD [Planctomycetota bacterium]MCL4730580.1 type II secretion system secretin GspD [Planctomycetota bacterium]
MRKVLAVLLLAFGASALHAQDTQEGLVMNGNLADIPLEEMIRATAEYQKIKFLYDPKKVTGTVTIVAPREGFRVPPTAMFSVLQTFLKQYKLVLSPFGEDTRQSVRFFEIIPAVEAITQSEQVIELSNLDNWTDTTADFVTLVVNLKFAEANSVRGALQNLVSRGGGQVNPIPGINSLIIADYSYNIRRLAQIIRLMDQPPRSPRLEVINVNHIDAEELVTSLNNLLNQRQQLMQATPGRVGRPDDETMVRVEVAPYVNAIMVTGFDAGIELVRELVRKIDVEIPGATTQGKIHYYSVKNTKAATLADVLNNVLGAGVPTAQPVVPGQPGVIGTSANAPTIVADETTNSLLVIATPNDYNEIRKIIDKLDIRRPQVMIEAAILEVRDDDDFTFGVELATVDGFANKSSEPRLSFGTQFGFSEIVDSAGVPISTGGGVPAGRNPIIGQGGLLTLNKGTAFDIPLLVRFLKTQTDTNVLQQPMLITNDNEPATIEIQSEIQLLEISQSTQGNLQGAGQFVEAGISMNVTPQISADGYVTLQIELDITNFVGESATPGTSPPRQKRTITTFVTAPDASTIVIGGLKSSESSKAVTKIPLLGDIPLIGELFKSQRTIERRTNLYIFIRPKILKDASFDDLRGVSAQKLREAESDTRKLDTPQKRDFFNQARADEESRNVKKPGTARRSFDYQGLPSRD